MTRHFLLIDDDIDDRELFTEALAVVDKDICCYFAEDAGEAFDMLEAGKAAQPDVIFLDINLPVISGWDCLYRLKNSRLYHDIPVIMYSTSSHQRDKDIAAELGALFFFTKPDNYVALIDFLHYVVDKVKNNNILSVSGFNDR